MSSADERVERAATELLKTIAAEGYFVEAGRVFLEATRGLDRASSFGPPRGASPTASPTRPSNRRKSRSGKTCAASSAGAT
jgi:hypothetical protein